MEKWVNYSDFLEASETQRMFQFHSAKAERGVWAFTKWTAIHHLKNMMKKHERNSAIGALVSSITNVPFHVLLQTYIQGIFQQVFLGFLSFCCVYLCIKLCFSLTHYFRSITAARLLTYPMTRLSWQIP